MSAASRAALSVWDRVHKLEAERDALRSALQLIAEPPRTDWMPGEYPLVINKMRDVAREALERFS